MNEKIIQCSGKEEIEELIENISNTIADDIILQFPKNSILFQQKTNLQNLLKIAEKNQKHLTIVTQNPRARKEIQSIGIQALATLEEKFPMEPTLPKAPLPIIPKLSTHPIDPEKFRSQKENLPASEAIQKISKPSLHALFLLGIFTTILFLFIVYFTIPSATIKITPHRKETEMHLNLEMLSQSVYTEQDVWKATNGVYMIPIETSYEYKGVYTDVYKKVEGDTSQGTIEIINTTKDPIMLKAGTRVQTHEGILYLLPHWIQIPAGKTKKIKVQANEEDVYKKVQAERANIKKGTLLIFPGLSQSVQKQVYAVSDEDFSGGSGSWKYSVIQKNIDDAKKEWEEIAKKQMYEALEKQKIAMEQDGKKLKILDPIDAYVHFEVASYSFQEPEDQLIGKAIPSFSGSIGVKVRAYAYEIDKVEEVIRSKFERLAPDGMKLLSVNTDIINLRIQNVNAEKNKIKLSLSTRGIYEFIVEPKSEKSTLFIKNAKEAIVGKTKEQAAVILLNNFKEISAVDISLFPFWNRKIPNLPEKITMTIETEK